MDMNTFIKRIDILKQELNSLRPFDPELNTLLQEKLRIEWTYNSNAIEGNTLTLGETAFFLREGLTSEGKPLKDYLEAKNHAEAIDGLMDVLQKKRPFTEGLIKELHAVLLKDMEFTLAKNEHGKFIKKPLHPGQYKTRPNHVLTLSGKVHRYTDPLHVKDEMEKLMHWFHEKTDLNPVEKAAVFHYRFVTIHPFDDGNGRLARLLMNLILMQFGYPPCIIKNAHRRKYLETLENADSTGDLEPFLEFVASELLETLTIIQEVLIGKKSAKIPGKLFTTVLNRQQRDTLILNALKQNPLTIQQLCKLLPEIKRPTLKSDLKRLVLSAKIHKKGVKKGTIYSFG